MLQITNKVLGRQDQILKTGEDFLSSDLTFKMPQKWTISISKGASHHYLQEKCKFKSVKFHTAHSPEWPKSIRLKISGKDMEQMEHSSRDLQKFHKQVCCEKTTCEFHIFYIRIKFIFNLIFLELSEILLYIVNGVKDS